MSQQKKHSDDVEKKIGELGKNFEEKWKELEKKIPLPLLSLGDTLCGVITLMVVVWIFMKIGSMDYFPTTETWGAVGIVILVGSLFYRFVMKK